LTLSWLAPFFGTPTSYILEAGTASGLVDIIVFNTGSTAVTISVSGVPSGTYYVRVRAVNALGTSVASNERIISVP
jgi:predicted nicotinamide N-methyase